jgi:hypothetical protein
MFNFWRNNEEDFSPRSMSMEEIVRRIRELQEYMNPVARMATSGNQADIPEWLRQNRAGFQGGYPGWRRPEFSGSEYQRPPFQRTEFQRPNFSSPFRPDHPERPSFPPAGFEQHASEQAKARVPFYNSGFPTRPEPQQPVQQPTAPSGFEQHSNQKARSRVPFYR